MAKQEGPQNFVDLFVIGGGVNGCAIARDACGRGLSVMLAEMDDIASATSSASTKLFHGGLRYLEYFEFRLVREALIEREVLLNNMPHISWPMRFVLPYHADMRFEQGTTPTSRLLGILMPWLKGKRPSWLIRLGLFMYDTLGGRKILPGTKTLDLTNSPEGLPLQEKFKHAYEYSDCWVQDSRLVVLTARDAKLRGATVLTRHKVVSAERFAEYWKITVENCLTGDQSLYCARALVNAAGPWVADVLKTTLDVQSSEGVRLVKGSHIITRKLFDHAKCYFFQGQDGRIIFAIPYEDDFTLIGTTDVEMKSADTPPECSDEERDYLCAFASNYFKTPVTKEDVVASYAGVRPLYDDGASSATAATRDYVLKLNQENGAPVLSVFGGKITTHRRLAESAMDEIKKVFPDLGASWTQKAPLPGGDFAVSNFETLVDELARDYPFLGHDLAKRLVRAYGTDAFSLLAGIKSREDMGQNFGAGLTECEVNWLIENEFALTAQDILWRRSKLALKMTEDEIQALDIWLKTAQAATPSSAAQ